jgi:peptidoglycan/xylan/chitin deacetylase (PgdA/CDA1 family)/glycosyltransferase involved in cell wall biosynthesis
MRILFIANDLPNPIHPTKAVFNLQLVRALSRQHEVQAVSPVSWLDEWKSQKAGGPSLPAERRAVIDGITIHYPRYKYPPRILRSYYSLFYWYSIRRTVKSLIKSSPPDLVLAYWVHPDGDAAVRAAKMVGATSAVIVGGSDVQIITADRRRERCVVDVMQRIDAVITVNQDLKFKVQGRGVHPEKIYPWSQGIDHSIFFPRDRADARRKLGIPTAGNMLLWVGRMAPVKGLEVLLEACAILKTRGIEFRLDLVGEGPLRREVEANCARRGLTDIVHFAGPREPAQLGDWYRAANLCVLSSWSEGLPNVLRESLACGTPFVASKVGGIGEIAGDHSRLFTRGKAADMADCIADSLAHPRPVTGQQSPSWDQSAAALIDILQPLTRRDGQTKAAPRFRQPSPWRPRQMIRSAMAAVLPSRRFIVRGPHDCSAVCLTFDDGPHPRITPQVLDILGEQNAKATFFVVGQRAAEYPELIRRIVREGHTLAHHTFVHADNPSQLSAAQLMEEIAKTDKVLRDIVAQPMPLFRPPHGKLSVAKLWALWRAGLTVVLWNRDPKDFAAADSAQLRAWFLENPLNSGDIVLMHDNAAVTPPVLEELIRSTRRAGLDFVTVDQWTSGSRPLPRPAEAS